VGRRTVQRSDVQQDRLASPTESNSVKILSFAILTGLIGIHSDSAVSAQFSSCVEIAVSGDVIPDGYYGQCAAPSPMLPQIQHERSPSDIAFTVDVLGSPGRDRDRVYTFALNNFSQQEFRTNTTPLIVGMDFSPDAVELFAITSETAGVFPRSLGVILQFAGDFIPVGQISGLPAEEKLNGLAIDPRTRAAYLSASNGSPPFANLYSLNLATAAATLIGRMNTPPSKLGTVMVSLAINCEGKLYAHNVGDDSLYLVNTASAATSLVGQHALDANFGQGMDFDNSDGQLYAFMTVTSGAINFGRFDTNNGAFTVLANSPPGQYEGAIPTACPPPLSLFANGFES